MSKNTEAVDILLLKLRVSSEFLATAPENPGSILGATRFSEK
jgi:hypothetical protein